MVDFSIIELEIETSLSTLGQRLKLLGCGNALALFIMIAIAGTLVKRKRGFQYNSALSTNGKLVLTFLVVLILMVLMPTAL